MKIVICSQSNTPQAMMDGRFGRTDFWAIFDTDGRSWTFLPNTPNLQAVQGAGIQAAQTIADADVNVLIACNVGPKAMVVLRANDIEVYQAQTGMTVGNAYQAFEAGQLKRIQNANVEGHWA